MHELKSKVGYIRGLIDGLGFDENQKEGKVLLHITEVLEEITEALIDLDTSYEDLLEYAETIDEDLMDLEDDYYDEEVDTEAGYTNVQEEDFEGGFSFECPKCQEIVYVDDDVLDEDEDLEILCPGCGEVVLINDWSEEEVDWESANMSMDEYLPEEDVIIDDNEEKE